MAIVTCCGDDADIYDALKKKERMMSYHELAIQVKKTAQALKEKFGSRATSKVHIYANN